MSELISDFKDFLARKRYFSLYFEIIFSTVLGVLIAAAIYIAAQIGSSYYINTELTSDIKKTEREHSYVEDLSEYAAENGISTKNADKLLDLDTSMYVQLAIYTDIPGKTGKEPPSRDEFLAYAADNGMYVIDLSDGAVLVSVNDITEYYYYNVSASINFFVSMLALLIVLFDRVRRIIKRVKRLESDVAVVSYSDMNHEIMVEGKNDIAKLASNIETMRIALVENLRKEQEARDANTELITSLSHDIRTPLTVILGYLEMMDKKNDDEQLKEYIEITEKTAMRLKLLSDDMFKYFLAYGNTGEEITLGEYDAETLLGQMLDEHLLLLSENGYTVETDKGELYFGQGVNVLTDADNLMRIFDNIFSNFYKYAKKSEPISIKMSRIGDVIVIEFRNKILEDTSGAESNRIGLRTCSRLAEFILESFEYSAADGEFFTRMVLKTTVSDVSPDIEPLRFDENT